MSVVTVVTLVGISDEVVLEKEANAVADKADKVAKVENCIGSVVGI